MDNNIALWIYEPHPTQVNVFDVYDSDGTLYFGLPEKVAKDFCHIQNSYSTLKAENERLKLTQVEVSKYPNSDEAFQAFGKVLNENDKLEKGDVPAKSYLRGMLFSQAFLCGRSFEKTIDKNDYGKEIDLLRTENEEKDKRIDKLERSLIHIRSLNNSRINSPETIAAEIEKACAKHFTDITPKQ